MASRNYCFQCNKLKLQLFTIAALLPILIPSVWAKILMEVVVDRAPVYSDRLLQNPIGFLRGGKKITVIDPLDGYDYQSTIYHTFALLGRLAYIETDHLRPVDSVRQYDFPVTDKTVKEHNLAALFNRESATQELTHHRFGLEFGQWDLGESWAVLTRWYGYAPALANFLFINYQYDYIHSRYWYQFGLGYIFGNQNAAAIGVGLIKAGAFYDLLQLKLVHFNLGLEIQGSPLLTIESAIESATGFMAGYRFSTQLRFFPDRAINLLFNLGYAETSNNVDPISIDSDYYISLGSFNGFSGSAALTFRI